MRHLIILALLCVACSQNEPDTSTGERTPVADVLKPAFRLAETDESIPADGKIENLDVKRGFKNIKLGMTEDEFNFGEGWGRETLGERIVYRSAARAVKDCVVGGDSLTSVRLSFLDQRLSRIDLGFRSTYESQSRLPELLKMAYGQSQLDEETDGSYVYRTEKENGETDWSKVGLPGAEQLPDGSYRHPPTGKHITKSWIAKALRLDLRRNTVLYEYTNTRNVTPTRTYTDLTYLVESEYQTIRQIEQSVRDADENTEKTESVKAL